MNKAGAFDLSQIGAMSVRELIDLRAAATPDAPYLIDPATGTVITYAALQRRACAVAASIAAQGVPPGSKIAYAMTNGPDTACVVLGII